MKKLMISMFLLLAAFAVKAQEATVSEASKIEFENKLYNFGEIAPGDTVDHVFTFKNIGTAPLKILSARGSCGCTVPKYSTDAVAPGKSGEVFVRFNSAGKRGNQNKTVTLVTNDPTAQQVILTLRGNIVTAGERKE
tara:strand:+ start:7611 stop:8021 length:411 start_codon:yes stop_codon:yes gene_type:complete